MQFNYNAEELRAVNEARDLVHSNPLEAFQLLDSVVVGYQTSGKVVCALESRSWQCFASLSVLKYDQAKLTIELLIAEATRADSSRFIGFGKLYLGIISAECDKSEEALDFLEEALQIATEIGDLDLKHRVQDSLAYAHIRFEHYENAIQTLNHCIRKGGTNGLPNNNSTIYFNIASATVQLAFRELTEGALGADRIAQVNRSLENSRVNMAADQRLHSLTNILFAVSYGLEGDPDRGLIALSEIKENAVTGCYTQRKALLRARCQLLEMANQWDELVTEAKGFYTEMEEVRQYSALNPILRQLVRAYAKIQNYKSAYEALLRVMARDQDGGLFYRKERVLLASLQQDLEQNKFDQEVLRMRNKTLIERNKALELEARYDPLSGLLNRRGTEEALQQFTERKFATRFLIALLDIDHFKRVNDKFGHAIGDQVIHEFSNCLISSVTNPAKIGRWGGEEFLIVFDVSDEHEMDTIGQKLVEEIRSLNWDHIHKGMKVTASVGLSMWCKGDSLDNAVRIADDMLYDVKHHGRDNWRSWPLDEAA